MADISENEPFTDPATAISQGKRHLLVRDYGMAVAALARACELLAQKHGDSSDELGEPYLLYGRALLYLAREDAGVLGTGVPGNDDAEEEGDEAGEEDEEETEDKAEKGEDGKEEEKDKEEKEKESNTIEDEKGDEKKTEEKTAEGASGNNDNAVAGTSKGDVLSNGKSSKAVENGTPEDEDGEEEEEEGSDDVNKEDEEDDIHNLQVAWEVLELAKLVLLKRGPPGWKHLAEAHKLLGEVAMETGNHQVALIDLKACLDLLNRSELVDPRAIAETHYQLGVAHSLQNEFDESIEQFNTATKLLEARVKELEDAKEPPKSKDPFYTVEGEIKELKGLLPEIQEKIADMKDFKQEAYKAALEGIRSKVGEGGCSNGAGPSGESSSASTSVVSPKPASDISHLVRKKRKIDEPEAAAPPPMKKPSL